MDPVSLLVSPAPQNMDKATVPSVTLIVGCGVSSLTLLMLVIIYVSVWRWVPAQSLKTQPSLAPLYHPLLTMLPTSAHAACLPSPGS